MAERAEGDSIKDDVAQPAVRTIRTSNNIRRQMEEEHTQLKVKEAFLYADNGILASTNLGWIQTMFDILTGLFDRVGLKTNFKRTVGMVCHICQAIRGKGRQ